MPRPTTPIYTGRYFWNKRTPEGFEKAIESFNRAIAKNPGYAAPYAGLADSYLLLGEFLVRPHEDVFPKARSAAERALELDPRFAEPHASLGALDVNQGNYKNAEREFQRALQIDPGYATAHQWYAEFLASHGRTEQALAEIRRARDLEPLSLVINTQVGWILFAGRRYDEAIETLRKVIEMDPGFGLAHGDLGHVHGSYWRAAQVSGIRKDPGPVAPAGRGVRPVRTKGRSAAHASDV